MSELQAKLARRRVLNKEETGDGNEQQPVISSASQDAQQHAKEDSSSDQEGMTELQAKLARRRLLNKEGNVDQKGHEVKNTDEGTMQKHGSKSSLSKYGPFNQNARPAGEARDDEEYGDIDPNYKPIPIKKVLKKSLSRYEPTTEVALKEERDSDEEEYGTIDPAYHAEKVALSSSGEYVVVPESSKKTPKKEEPAGKDSDDDSPMRDASSSGKKVRRPLSNRSPMNSAYVFDDNRKESFQNMKLESDDEAEDYGPIDPNYKPDKVVKSKSGRYTTVDGSSAVSENSGKVLKKTLSKYGGPSSDRAPSPRPVSNTKNLMRKAEDDEDYGDIDPTFKPDPVALTKSGHYTVLTGTPAEKGLKKTLSKYGSPSTELAERPATPKKDEDEDYGDIDPTYHAEQVVMSSSGYIAPPAKTMKKTLSKYGSHSAENINIAVDVAKPHGSAIVEVDEDYGDIDPTYKPEPVVLTKSGHYTVASDQPQTQPKVMKKTLSKYKDSFPVPVAPQPTLNPAKEEEEDYGNDIDTHYLDPSVKKEKAPDTNVTN